jgi:hypothetical protein
LDIDPKYGVIRFPGSDRLHVGDEISGWMGGMFYFGYEDYGAVSLSDCFWVPSYNFAMESTLQNGIIDQAYIGEAISNVHPYEMWAGIHLNSFDTGFEIYADLYDVDNHTNIWTQLASGMFITFDRKAILIPEPKTLILLCIGLIGLKFIRSYPFRRVRIGSV